MKILGLSAYYHDSAAALVVDGEIVAAAQEERFTRIKGDSNFPHRSVAYCLEAAGISERDLDHVVYYENPSAKFERLLSMYHLGAPYGLKSFLRAMPSWLSNKLWLEQVIAREMGIGRRVILCDHHVSHAASAFYPSPFDEAAILTIDGVGEWSTATWGVGRGNKIELKKQLRFPNSLGLLYSAFTHYTGFKINSGEYKLMGLAPYGVPRHVDEIERELVFIADDGAVTLNQEYFDYIGGLTMTNARFDALFGGPARQPEAPITQREMDIAASIQAVTTKIVLKMAAHVFAETKLSNLCLAGGVSLNVVANGELSRSGPFSRIWVQPAAGDAGAALGAALWMWHHELGSVRKSNPMDSMHGAFLGPEIRASDPRDDAVLGQLGAVWEDLGEDALAKRISSAIAAGKIVAVARGRMEFGPRALGSRSILGDARSPDMQSRMNLKIKFRESFRPFAPMVLEEDLGAWFDARQESPYMAIVYPVREEHRRAAQDDGLFGIDRLKVVRSDIPAVTHVDFSARIQTIDRARNPFMHRVISDLKEATGCPVIVNTSFNVRGEPIVNTVEDAFRCFMATEIDCLVVGNRFLEASAQKGRALNDAEREKWLKRFELD